MEFIIGTTNKAKLKAVKEVLIIHFPHALITEFEVCSGVSNQPFGDEETRLGALNRALRVAGRKQVQLDWSRRWRSILEEQMYLCNWGALALPDGRDLQQEEHRFSYQMKLHMNF